MLIEKLKKERRESKVTFKKKPDRSRSPSSVNRELELLSKIFSLAVKYRVTADNPCSDLKLLPVDNKRIRYLTDEEMPRLFAQLTGQRAHLRPLVIVAIGTGTRLGDQLSLGWEQVDFQRNLIYVPNAKTGKDYPLPMNKGRETRTSGASRTTHRQRVCLRQSEDRHACQRNQEGLQDRLPLGRDQEPTSARPAAHFPDQTR